MDLKYGGIYVDMDYFCHKNFFNELNLNNTYITESPHTQCEYLQNSLIITPKNSCFFYHVIDESYRRMNFNMSSAPNCNTNNRKMDMITFTTGPKLLSDVYDRKKNSIMVLNKELFNPANVNIVGCYTTHFGTGEWMK